VYTPIFFVRIETKRKQINISHHDVII